MKLHATAMEPLAGVDSTTTTTPEQEVSNPVPIQRLLSEPDASEKEAMKVFKEVLREKNRNHFMKKTLFNSYYFSFFNKILGGIASRCQQQHHGQNPLSEIDFNIFKFEIILFLTTVIRHAEKYYSYEFLRHFAVILAEVLQYTLPSQPLMYISFFFRASKLPPTSYISL